MESQRVQLLSHPLVAYLLRHKWNSSGRYVYYAGLALYAIFLFLLTRFVTSQPAPFNVPEIIKFSDNYHEVLANVTACESLVPYSCVLLVGVLVAPGDLTQWAFILYFTIIH